MGRIVGENKHKGTLYPVDSKAIYRIIYEVVAVLPTENIKTSVIYCVPIIGKDNEYDMFLYINGWSKIGSGSIDLSDYYTKEEVDDMVADISTLSFKIVQEKPTEDIETNIIYLIPKSGSTAGNIYEEWIYIDDKWELLGTTDIDLSSYMTLAPLNPTAEQIAAMSAGQLYGDTVNHKGTIKGGQEFYDTGYIDNALREKQKRIIDSGAFVGCSYDANLYSVGDYYYDNTTLYRLQGVRIIPGYSGQQPIYEYYWRRSPTLFGTYGGGYPSPIEREDPATVGTGMFSLPTYQAGDFIQTLSGIYLCIGYMVMRDPVMNYRPYYSYSWEKVAYTKTEIDQKGYLTLETLPIYDGTVI